MSNPIYALILAGGSGERFWPLSRRNRPKQLLRLVSERTLLEETVARLEGFVPAERVLILTNIEQEKGVRDLLEGFPKQNIIAEPAKRDTAAAVALGAGWVAARDHSATMLAFPADHVIADRAAFQETMKTAAAAAEETGALVTIGIKPTWACPGFGYIEQGSPLAFSNGPSDPPVFEVTRFREKPNAELAESFLAQGHFRWNAGMFIWTVRAILSAFNRHAPALGEFIGRLHAGEDFPALLRDAFPALPKISIDYAILEKATRVLMVEAAFDWDDVGGWGAVAKYLAGDEDGNHGNCTVKTIEAANNIVFSSDARTVALIGVSDLIVVQTPDAILVCHRQEAERIKQ